MTPDQGFTNPHYLELGPCVEWTGQVNNKGYGVVHVGLTTTTTAHRAAWITAHGPIPDDWQVDHLCRNRLCVNVDHLEAVTASENYRRTARAQVTHCPAGHPLSGDNLYYQTTTRTGRPWRRCRACAREAGRRYEERKKS